MAVGGKIVRLRSARLIPRAREALNP
jgi:hypothetical protein